MTRKVDNMVIIEPEPEPDAKCEMCGNMDELRPYGPGGMKVCFSCGMKDEKEAIRQYRKFLNGPGEKAH